MLHSRIFLIPRSHIAPSIYVKKLYKTTRQCNRLLEKPAKMTNPPLTLAVGTHLGPYQIRTRLGAGGMGEVYLAFDPRLERLVALKVLPPELASDRRRMHRFVQEAKTTSGLNHPNLLTIHEI